MPDFIKNFEFTPINILKVIGGIFLVLFIGLFVKSIVSSSFGSPSATSGFLSSYGKGASSVSSVTPSAYYDGSAHDAYTSDGSARSFMNGKEDLQLSVNNVKSSIGVPPILPRPSGSAGDDAENYEVTDYNVTIETRNKENDCNNIKALKKLSYVIFENANDYERGCTYLFKVEHEKVEEVLTAVLALNPKNVSQNVYTIKSQIIDYTSEADILKKKIDSIDETLKNALKAYEEISTLAIRNQNSDALAKIIDSKINIIERLTQERINVSSQLDRLERSKADQLDRIKYTYFNISIYENVYIDGQSIRDSWKNSVKNFIVDINQTLQGLTVNLVSFFLIVFQYLLYFFIILFVAKFVWKVTKDIWNK